LVHGFSIIAYAYGTVKEDFKFKNIKE